MTEAKQERPARLVQRRVSIGFGAAMALAVALGVLSLAALRRSVANDRLAFQEAAEIVELGQLRSDIERKMAAYREYMATAAETAPGDLSASRAAFTRTLGQLRDRAPEAERILLDEIARAEGAQQDALDQTIAMKRSGMSRDAIAPFMVREGGARRQVLEAAIDRLLAVKHPDMRQSAERSERWNAQATWLIAGVALAVVVVLLLLGEALSRRLRNSFEVERGQRERAEAAERRSSFLAQASEALGSSLEYRQTLASVARLAVTGIADWCFVDMIENGAVQRLAVAHRDPEQAAFARELEQLHLLDPHAGEGPPRVLRTGESELRPEVTDEFLRSIALTPQTHERLRKLEIRSYLCVPIRSRGSILGIVTCSLSKGRFGPADLELAEELGRRAGIAIDNARLYRDARNAIQVRDDFLSVASHELNTPITTLRLQIQRLARRDPGNPPDPGFSERLRSAERQTDKLARLIGDMLDLSRISAGPVELERKAVSLAAVVKDSLAQLSEEFARAGCAVALSVGEEGGREGDWDPVRLDQIVANLFSNAIKYGQGKPVEVFVGGDRETARLTVRDRGIGIDAEDQRRIFGQFERAVSLKHYGGLGLGLWIVRQIVEAHGGEVTVESRPGVGAVFTVELPRRLARQERAETPSPSAGGVS